MAALLGRSFHLEEVLVAVPAALVARIDLDAEAAVKVQASRGCLKLKHAVENVHLLIEVVGRPMVQSEHGVSLVD